MDHPIVPAHVVLEELDPHAADLAEARALGVALFDEPTVPSLAEQVEAAIITRTAILASAARARTTERQQLCQQLAALLPRAIWEELDLEPLRVTCDTDANDYLSTRGQITLRGLDLEAEALYISRERRAVVTFYPAPRGTFDLGVPARLSADATAANVKALVAALVKALDEAGRRSAVARVAAPVAACCADCDKAIAEGDAGSLAALGASHGISGVCLGCACEQLELLGMAA